MQELAFALRMRLDTHRQHQRGRYGVHSYLRSTLYSQALDQMSMRRLGHRICLHKRRHVSQVARHVYTWATEQSPHHAAPADRQRRRAGHRHKRALRRLKIWPSSIHQPQMTLHIDVEAIIPVALLQIVIEIRDISDMRPALVRKDGIQAPLCTSAEDRHSLVHKPFDIGTTAKIGLDGREIGAALDRGQRRDRLELFDESVGALGVAVVVDDNAHAGAGEEPGRGGADAGGAEGDERSQGGGHGELMYAR